MKMKKLLLGIVLAILTCLTFMANTNIDYVPHTMKIDKTYLERAVVSEQAVPVEVEIRNAAKQVLWDAEVNWTVVAGTEVVEVVDNQIFVRKAGDFTLLATAKDKTSVSASISGTAYDVTLSNVTFNTKFEDITVYTQPIRLSGSIDVVGIIAPGDCHYELAYRVVSGPAELYCDEFLKITGVGEVTVETYSIYDPAVKATKTFTVTDPEADKVVDSDFVISQGSIVKEPVNVAAIVLIAVGVVVALGGGTLVFLLVRKNKKKEN